MAGLTGALALSSRPSPLSEPAHLESVPAPAPSLPPPPIVEKYEPLAVLPDPTPIPPELQLSLDALRARLDEQLVTEPSGRLPLRPGQGEALVHYMSAAAALDLAAKEEAALRAWARTPGERIPERVHDALKRGRAALADLEAGANAPELGSLPAGPPDPSSSPPPPLGRALALGRLALAQGRHELDGGSLRAATDRAVVALRLGQDLASTGGEHVLQGAALQREAVRAIGAWLTACSQSETRSADLEAIALLLARATRGPAPPIAAPELRQLVAETHDLAQRLVELALRTRVSLTAPGSPP